MSPADTLTVPIEIPASLLVKVREAAQSVAPGKRVKIALTMSLDGTITATAGVRAGKFVNIGVIGYRDPVTGAVGGVAQAVIEFCP